MFGEKKFLRVCHYASKHHTSSDLLSAVNLLVQQLLIRLNKAFVEPTRFAVDHATLRQFLLQDCTLLLLITIYLVGLQVIANCAH